MRINPGIYVLDLGPDRRQFGLGEGALLLAGLTVEDHAFINALRKGVPDGEETAAGAAAGLDGQRQEQLLRVLAPVLLAQPGRRRLLPPLREERLRPDVERLSAVYGRDALDPLALRGAAVVEVLGLGRCGALTARILAAAGVGTVFLGDPGVVSPGDVGPAFALTDIGMTRYQAVKRQLYRIDPTVRVLQVPWPDSGTRAAVDLTILASDQPAPRHALPVDRLEQPHLAVSVQQYGYQVGPLVVPGTTPCLGCLDRHRGDADPGWYASAAALPPDAREPVHGAGPGGEETASAALAAAAAAGQALGFIDGVAQPVTWSAVLQLRAADGHVGLEPLGFHPGCGCRLQSAAA
ncbi:ThiF family adenylyltransferase [Arthrobacter gandavensis]|uniref:ThiF family adenylyltransferase n=1 Tax=Arthrobacter gandavensis TaxID=169960 RepID=UPI00188EACB2|nr:ThiF family adenylyltransferase [Arthrobacter gandavensis]MBF4993709.1 ThiF family adenylyltransferase [Arthrobacter gandavensis]